MPVLLHPGVYVQEIPSPVRSIEGAPTSTTIFVGETERGPIGPTKIKSRSEYERLFGDYMRRHEPTESPSSRAARRVLMTYAIDGFFQNGGSSAYVLRAMEGHDTARAAVRRGDLMAIDSPSETTTDTPIVEASSPGIWGDDISVTFLDARGGDPALFRIAVVYRSPRTGEARLVETWDKLSLAPADENYAPSVLERSLFVRYVADPAAGRPDADVTGTPRDSDIIAASEALSGGAGGAGALDVADYQAILGRYLAGVEDAALLVAACETFLDLATDDDAYLDYVNAFIGFAEARPRQDLFFIGEMPPQRNEASTDQATNATVNALSNVQRSNFAGLYWPFVVVGDRIGVGRNPTLTIPPSGHLAGVFARTDARRGVWKAPAGVEAIINGSLALSYELNDAHSDELNPRGINALRQIPAAGRVVWGARTLQPNSEWRYNAVRRTAIFLRTSIYNGIQWAVFEPNDEPLWQSLRVSIGGFMETQFRNGAFAGATSDQAYFVKVDSETTTEIDRAAGIVNILVGFAPLRPAEFVVVSLSQKTQLSD